MNFSAEKTYPFHEPSAAKLASGFTTQFSRIVSDPEYLSERVVCLTEFSQNILSATDAKSLASGGIMTFDKGGSLNFGIIEDDKPPVNEGKVSVIIGDEGVELSNEPYPIPYHDALSYLARPDPNSYIKETYDLPVPFDNMAGIRTYLISHLCQNDERLIEWVKTPQGNMDLRKILLDAAITDRADIERYHLREQAFGFRDEILLTKCVTNANYKQVSAMFTKLIKDLTQRDKPSPFAPLMS